MKNYEFKYPSAPPNYPLYDSSTVNDEEGWMINNVHDPAIVKDGDWYYTFSTDRKVCSSEENPLKLGLQIRRSKNLIDWEWVGYALDGIPKEAKDWTDAQNLWAPDVVKFGDDYYLYYAASQFGTNHSLIGLAKSKSITGPWTTAGEVFKTKSDDDPNASGDTPNAIDPNLFFSKTGKPWMVYGSFFGGIYVTRIDRNTGKLINYNRGNLIAKRSSKVEGAIEGPYIVYNEEFDRYYLFVSYDSLFTDYNIRVGRADKITGPYLDYQGNCMTDTDFEPQSRVGTKIVGGYSFANDEGWQAPGHNSILKDEDDYYIVHHARGGKKPEWSYLHVRKILWTDDGWPVASPERFAGEELQKVPQQEVVGDWEIIIMDPDRNKQLQAENLKFLENGKITGEIGSGSWHQVDDYSLKFNLVVNKREKNNYQVKMISAWDWENWNPTLVFTGLNQDGVAIWGKRNS
ncbi:beta-xylosidase [Halobacteroides halobius DSM 5150]|uniref:Beta-xylosidase n=1 Tax=Halobacteroides halobius (strain ATCC 35273 / DSM 5150 / MD-1) TaxID=748449 RepID=L0KB93_HALHC|nr:arabinan endo-1,5-alpha-L-arabinosidase [Halobacteroides halobius]AGB41654.1 beta-xylosidase [Halobacteroides halobius DSM 5150]